MQAQVRGSNAWMGHAITAQALLQRELEHMWHMLMFPVPVSQPIPKRIHEKSTRLHSLNLAAVGLLRFHTEGCRK